MRIAKRVRRPPRPLKYNESLTTMTDQRALLRRLPAIDRVQGTAEAKALREQYAPRLVDDALRDVVESARSTILSGEDPGDLAPGALAALAGARIAALLAPGVQRCINATGVVLHTGLGRAALAPAALEALTLELSGYSVVSVNLEEGQRLRRESAIARLLAALTGAEAATLVNNNAAATVIALNTLAAGREAIVSRGQLVEIGGSFRMPDVFRAAGVALREVGTTNRTHTRDFRTAIGEETGLLLRVHPSNYKVIGFTQEVGIDELVTLGREHDLPVMDDLGAGALVPLEPEPTIAESLKSGVDVVTCSGDKLIGGPQAGVILGRREWIDRIRTNPLFRALRVDKMTLVALEATLRLFLRPEGPGDDHPTLRMLRLTGDECTRRARALARRIKKGAQGYETSLAPGFSQVGSGSMPGESLPTTLVTLVHAAMPASTLARRLRLGRPPVFTRIADERVCVDPRTILPGEEAELVRALADLESSDAR